MDPQAFTISLRFVDSENKRGFDEGGEEKWWRFWLRLLGYTINHQHYLMFSVIPLEFCSNHTGRKVSMWEGIHLGEDVWPRSTQMAGCPGGNIQLWCTISPVPRKNIQYSLIMLRTLSCHFHTWTEPHLWLRALTTSWFGSHSSSKEVFTLDQNKHMEVKNIPDLKIKPK